MGCLQRKGPGFFFSFCRLLARDNGNEYAEIIVVYGRWEATLTSVGESGGKERRGVLGGECEKRGG